MNKSLRNPPKGPRRQGYDHPRRSTIGTDVPWPEEVILGEALAALGKTLTLPPRCACGDYLGQGDCAACQAARIQQNQPDERTRYVAAKLKKGAPMGLRS